MTAHETPPGILGHYDDEPYPPRDPQEENRRLLWTSGGNLLEINHHCFHGRKNFYAGFRCLVAGGGSGDCLIFLAEQLRDTDAEIVYLDISPASRDLARARAEVRGLDNIRWEVAAISDLPDLGLGRFDFINCSGVLHHIRPPVSGLAVLADALTDAGAIYLMMYGKYGRQSITDLQLLLREALPAGLDIPEQVRQARQFIATLPEDGKIRQDLARMQGDMQTDADFYDLILYDMSLYEWDVNFSIPEIWAMAEDCDLRVLDFVGRPGELMREKLGDPEVAATLSGENRQARFAYAERHLGTLRKHELFVGKAGAGAASLQDDGYALLANGSLRTNAPQIAATMPSGQMLNYQDGTRGFSLLCDDATKVIFAHLDGQTRLKNLYRKLVKQTPLISMKDARAAVAQVYGQLHARDYAYLVEAGAPGKTLPDQAELLARTS